MHYIGIDLGGTVIKVGLVREGQMIGSRRLEANSKNGLKLRLEMIANAVEDLRTEFGIPLGNLGGGYF